MLKVLFITINRIKNIYKHSQDNTHLQPGVVFTSVVLRKEHQEHKILLISNRQRCPHSLFQVSQRKVS